MQINLSEPSNFAVVHGLFFGTNSGNPGSKPPGGEMPGEATEPTLPVETVEESVVPGEPEAPIQ